MGSIPKALGLPDGKAANVRKTRSLLLREEE
jgi:hypothetical protein